MSYTAPRTWTAAVVTVAQLNEQIRDNELAIVGGMVGVGFTLVDLLGAVAPAVSAASHAKIIYNTTTARLEASINGGAYNGIGFPANSATAIIGHQVFS